MKFGTAAHRLKKLIMFRLIQKTGEDNCHQCGERIASADELSIEHKSPWMDVSPDLFWDLDNIAFSHGACNYLDRRQTKQSQDRTIHKQLFRMNKGPEGTAWCGAHKAYLPIDRFSKDCNRWSGLQDRCRECRSKLRSPRKHLNKKLNSVDSALVCQAVC